MFLLRCLTNIFLKGNAAETKCFGKTELFSVDYANFFRSGQIADRLLITAVKSISAVSIQVIVSDID